MYNKLVEYNQFVVTERGDIVDAKAQSNKEHLEANQQTQQKLSINCE